MTVTIDSDPIDSDPQVVGPVGPSRALIGIAVSISSSSPVRGV